MSLRKSFIVFLVVLFVMGTILPTSGYALSDPADAIITTESSAENVDVSMEDLALPDAENLDVFDPDIHEEPEGVDDDIEDQEDAPTVTEDTYGEDSFTTQAMALAEEQVIVMYPGDSYSFTNTGTRSKSLSTDAATSRSSSYDYAVYKADGSISTDNMNSTSSLSVGAGYTAVVTSSGVNAFTVTIPVEFTYSVSENPALHKATLSKGESYRFVNEGTQTRAVSADTSTAQDRKYDYANYNEDGSLSGSNFESTGKPYLGGGNEIIFTGAGSQPVTIGLPYEVYTGEWSDEPAYTRVTLGQGESYQFTNISEKSDALQSDGSTKDKHDYVVYLPNGTESSTGTNTSTKPTVAAGRTAVVTLVTATPVTYGVPYRTFDVQKAGGDAITRVTVYPGESVIFRNNGSLANPIKNNASSSNGALFDYVLYTSEDVVHSDGFNKNTNTIIRSQGYAVVTVVGQVPIEFSYTDDFSVEDSMEPAYHRVTLNQGESVTFWNNTTDREYLDSDASTSQGRIFDYVTYYPDGTERSTRKATAVEPVVFYGNKAVVTNVSAQPVTIGGIYTIFDVEGRPNEALSKITVSPGQSVKFHNGGSLSNPIRSNAKSVGSLYDVAVYKADGRAHSDKFNNNGSLATIPSGGEAIVTVVGSTPVLFEYTDDFSVVDSQEPAYLRVTLNQGESYAFTNTSSDSERLRNDASSSAGRLYDYTIYNVDGTQSSSRTATAIEPTILGGKEVVVTTVSDQPVIYGGIYRVFTGQENGSSESEIIGTRDANDSVIKYVNIDNSEIPADGNQNQVLESNYLFSFDEVTGETDVVEVGKDVETIEAARAVARISGAQAGTVLVNLIQNPIEGTSQIEVRSKIIAITGKKPNKIVFDFDLFRGNARGSGMLSQGVTLQLKGLLGVKVGKEVSYTFKISKTGFYFTELKLNVYDAFGRKYNNMANVAQTRQTLLNLKAMIYPYYKDPVSQKIMTEPSTTTWAKTPSIDWDSSTDRRDYIKKYSELYPRNGYNWAGSEINIHHIRPREFGGTNEFSNLIPIPTNFHVYVVNAWWRDYIVRFE
ncbi:HNH endonuclease signature motif containing protein [Paenibacillus illinoisensis]|uniref:Fibronectin type III domain-containing protein n=1 Tax=Paenibacillus illinoisensis TaxID=59845 RepID=A0A2W0C3B0_9BACL|nr:HNH endonuclease signature motif containing protein [Paenibacillus illinoisensis]PYY26983.1 Fibronectin type III domain-containing protein [Paenibacillus illinoisensis]